MERNDGGTAFPVSIRGWGDNGACGMSLRDYFAITLLAGDARQLGEGCNEYMEQLARVAYAYADAMLKARQQ